MVLLPGPWEFLFRLTEGVPWALFGLRPACVRSLVEDLDLDFPNSLLRGRADSPRSAWTSCWSHRGWG